MRPSSIAEYTTLRAAFRAWRRFNAGRRDCGRVILFASLACTGDTSYPYRVTAWEAHA